MIKRLLISVTSILILLIVGLFIFCQPDISEDWIKEKYTDGNSKFIEIQNIDVHYKDEGKGAKTLLLLHGTGSSLHTWDGWVKALKDSLRIVRLDLPAFGVTGPFSDHNYTKERYLEFLNSFITAINLDTFAVAGNSFGGYLAWNFTISNPQQVSELILLDASGYPTEKDIGVFKLAKNPITAFFLKKLTPRSFIHKNLMEVYGNDDLISDQLIDRYWHMARRKGNRQAFIDRVNTVYDDGSMLISNIKNPTLILWGDKDTWTEVDHAYLFNNDIPDSKLIIYPGIGHTVMEEDPEMSAKDALMFLTSGN